MSHEVLLLAGPKDPDARRRRRQIVEHAGRAIPNAKRVSVHETSTTCLGVVATHLAGGDVIDVDQGGGGIDVVLALSTDGVSLARDLGHEAGTEGGHVRVRLDPAGPVESSTDGFATIPLFWSGDRTVFRAATHLASMISLGHPPTLDMVGLLTYLVMLHPLDQRTLLEDVRLVSPGGVVEWVPERGARERSRPLFVPAPQDWSDSQALHTFAETWRELTVDMLERADVDRMLLGLSGGLDSRAIAAQMVACGSRPLAYTYGAQRNREVQIARSLADRLSLSHLVLPIADERLLRGADRAHTLLDGAHSSLEMYELWFDDVLRRTGGVAVNGVAGDPLWGNDLLMGLVEPADLANQVWSKYQSAALGVMPFLGPALPELETVVRDEITTSLQRWQTWRRSDVGVFWRIANRQVRWGNSFLGGFRRSGLHQETPFLDRRMLRFAAGLSPEQRRNGHLYLRAHRELFPETSDLPRTSDGNAPRNLDHVYWSSHTSYGTQMLALGRRHPVSAIRRASRQGATVIADVVRDRARFSGPADRFDERASVFPEDLWARTRPLYAAKLAEMLQSALGVDPILDEEVIASAINGLRTGEVRHSTEAVGKVATLAGWLKDYDERARSFEQAKTTFTTPGREDA